MNCHFTLEFEIDILSLDEWGIKQYEIDAAGSF